MDLNPINQLNLWLIPATMVIVIFLVWALGRIFVRPYLVVMEERESLFDEAESRYADADRITAEARARSESLMSDARERADEVRRAAFNEADEYRREKVGAATREATQRLEQGRAKVATEREAEIALLRERALDCVGLACTRLLGSSDDTSVADAVDNAISRLTV